MKTATRDGITPDEFGIAGLFGYTPGAYATPGYSGDATLNPYKYFADGLGKNDDLWDFLTTTSDNGVFSSGTTNTRNYYLRFPNTIGVSYGYAVVANWEEVDVHPSNAPEAVGCDVVDSSNVYYVDPITNGGDLILDISLFGWDYQPSKIFIESTVLSAVAEFDDPGAIATAGGNHFSTYHVEIPANNVTGTEDNEFWVIAQYDDFDYNNDMGVPNMAGSDKLAAFFRYDLSVGDEIPVWIEVLVPNGGEEWGCGTDEEITWDSINVTGTVFIEYSKDNFVSDINPITSDELNDGSFMWDPIPDDLSTTVRVRVSSTDDPGIFDISDEDFSIVESGWARTWGGPGYDYHPSMDSDIGYGVATDGSGNVYVTGEFRETVDFDPGVGEDWHSTSGGHTPFAFLSKFDALGNFEWARTWGGSPYTSGYGVAADGSGNVYVTGIFAGTADFDPGAGTDYHYSNGSYDVFLSKLDSSSGNFQWAKTWGGSSVDRGYVVAADGSDVYVTGYFSGTVDFDPGSGVDNHYSSGGYDVFLSKFDSSGDNQWTKTWGSSSADIGFAVVPDGSGNVYVCGHFNLTVDFDPGSGVDNHYSNGSDDVFLSKFDSSGDAQWANTWGGSGSDSGYYVTSDGLNAYVTGYFNGIVDFEPGSGVENHASNGSNDVFLSKFLPDGSW